MKTSVGLHSLVILLAGTVLLGGVSTTRADVVAYYSFDDASNAAAAPDDSGNGNDGVILGTAAYSPDGGGFSGAAGDRAMDFGPVANGAVIELPTAATGGFQSLFDTQEATISMWWFGNDEQPVNQVQYIFLNGSERQYLAHTPWSNANIYFDVSGCCAASTQRINAVTDEANFKGRWNHYAFRKQGATSSIWINGVKFLESQGDMIEDILEIDSAFIGASSAGGGDSVSGLIDDFVVWDEAIDDATIADIAAGAPPVGEPPALRGDFNDDGSINLDDYGVLLANFLEGRDHAEGNFNQRGTVDLVDHFAFREAYAAANPAAASVPEPSTFVLAACGLLALVGLHRRRRR